MRSFIILLCIGMACAGSDLFDEEKMYKTWANHKAMETCYGPDMIKTTLIKMKTAVVKCTGMDMPELELPIFKSPHRVIHALLEGAQDVEQMKLMSALKGLHQKPQSANSNPTLQLVLGGQQAQPQEDMFKKMMMKMMMKKLFKDEMGPFGSMGGNKEQDNKFDILKMLTNAGRNRRAADDVFELGDRLTEKLKMETQKIQGELGNMSCILQELRILDNKQDLDINGMIQSMERDEWGTFSDEWVKEQSIKNCRQCVNFAEAIPRTILQDCPYGEKWGRIKMFMMCDKFAKMSMCMNHDVKLKLEKNFGKLEDLEEATGLQENQLLPLTAKLLNEQMEMFE